jgi:ferredoxin
MAYIEMVFSPTGGTRRAADELVRAWGAAASVVDLSDPHADGLQVAFRPQDVVIVAAPVFGGGVSQRVLDRIARVEGGGARCIVLCAYGNRDFGDALAQLRDTALSCGFVVVGAVAAVAEHSIVRKYGTGRPDADDLKTLRRFARELAPLLADAELAPLDVPGNGARVNQRSAGLPPKPTRACTGCGACAAVCPFGAIDEKDPRAVDENLCLGCMRCAKLCPAHARKTGAVMTKLVEFALAKPCAERKEPQLFLATPASVPVEVAPTSGR